MKYIDKYKSMGILSENAAFEYLLSNLKDTIRTYDFFVAWEKVLGNVSQIEVSLNILNSLIGKEDISIKLKDLIKQYPEVVPVIPFLIAVRGTSIKVADIGGDIEYSFSKNKTYTDEQIDKIICFAEKITNASHDKARADQPCQNAIRTASTLNQLHDHPSNRCPHKAYRTHRNRIQPRLLRTPACIHRIHPKSQSNRYQYVHPQRHYQHRHKARCTMNLARQQQLLRTNFFVMTRMADNKQCIKERNRQSPP